MPVPACHMSNPCGCNLGPRGSAGVGHGNLNARPSFETARSPLVGPTPAPLSHSLEGSGLVSCAPSIAANQKADNWRWTQIPSQSLTQEVGKNSPDRGAIADTAESSVALLLSTAGKRLHSTFSPTGCTVVPLVLVISLEHNSPLLRQRSLVMKYNIRPTNVRFPCPGLFPVAPITP